MKRNYRFFVLAFGLILLPLQVAKAQDLTSARAVIEANIEATGGLRAWRSVTDLVTEADIEFAIPQLGSLIIKLEGWSLFPGYGYTSIALIDGPAAVPADQVNQKAYYTPLEGWVETAAGKTDINSIPAAQRAQFQRSSPKNELEYLNLPDSALVLLDAEMLGDKPVYAVNVTSNGTTSKFLFDKTTFHVVGQETPTPMGNFMTLMSDFRKIKGFTFAFVQTADLGAQGQQTITFSKVEVNSGLTADAIAKKAGVVKTVAPE
ncbi:MAG: hypothetical protein O3B41_08725 [Bacteroidetes bacterium]|nr:hypothetical protein [Bacteroidota bacterium]